MISRDMGETDVRTMILMLRATMLSLAPAVALSSATVAVAQPAPSVSGAWKGAFLGTNFTFEFSQTANGWTGRYQSDRSGKWAELQNVVVSGATVRFTFASQPPSSFTLTLDPSGSALNGTAQFGDHPPLPLALTRAA